MLNTIIRKHKKREQLAIEVKMNRTSFLCGNRNGKHSWISPLKLTVNRFFHPNTFPHSLHLYLKSSSWWIKEWFRRPPMEVNFIPHISQTNWSVLWRWHLLCSCRFIPKHLKLHPCKDKTFSYQLLVIV